MMYQTADNDDRVVVVRADDEKTVCPVCEEVISDWVVAVDTEQYDADVTHRCPSEGCEGAASIQY